MADETVEKPWWESIKTSLTAPNNSALLGNLNSNMA